MRKNRSNWNEATRVQMPALVHLTRIGYTYFGKISEDMSGSVYDPDTNILIRIFKEQFSKLNPDHAGEAEAMLRTIRQELDNDDIGESFYKRLKAISPVRLIDFDHPENSTYHCTAEFTCKRDEDEFRPDIALFVNGLPLVFIEVKNRPHTQFRIENYIILMIVAWTKLFHAYFQATIGERYFYKEKNGRFKRVDGEKKAWELSECIKNYQKYNAENKLSEAVVSNLRFFIGIRNKIEHRYWDSSTLDILLFGECQSLLYNYENLAVELFGNDYSINTSLAYALQFSHLRATEQLKAQRELLSKDMQDIKKYIDKYKTDLTQEIYDSQEYSIKLLQIPKISNTNRADLAVEFVNWNAISTEDKENYAKVTAIIKDKIVKQNVSNANMLRPIDVRNAVKEKTDEEISQSNHTDLWKAFSVRPNAKSDAKFDTVVKYCVYDEPHNDYLYTTEWVDFIVRLVTKYGFKKENIHRKCAGKLNLKDFD